MRRAPVAASPKGDSYLRFKKLPRSAMFAALLLIAFSPGIAGACACGCSVFDVDTPSLIPNGPGGQVWSRRTG